MLTRNLRWRGGTFALVIATFFISHRSATAGVDLRSLRADDGIERAPTEPVPFHVVSMPVVSESSFLQPAGIFESNLGTFDIVINAGAALSGNPAALAAFNRAAAKWEARISDPITVNIDADLAVLPPMVLGQAGSVLVTATYNSVRTQMINDAALETDDGVVAFLPTAAGFSAAMPAGYSLNGSLLMTKANAKALNFSVPDGTFGVADATITFSSSFPFDFDNSDGVNPAQFDFEAVAAHEIGHALGFTSIVDFYSFNPPQPLPPTTLDLFRFDDTVDPTSLATFTTTSRSLVTGNTEHFDQINGSNGAAAEILFENGVGQQASHWKDNLGLGLMDPTLAPGELGLLKESDFRAIDLIGYSISTIPESSSFNFVLVGTVLALGGWKLAAARQARRASTPSNSATS